MAANLPEKQLRWLLYSAAVALAGLAAAQTPALTPTAEPRELALACSPDHLSVEFGGSVRLRAWGSIAPGETLSFRWSSEDGDLRGEAAEVLWTPTTRKAGQRSAKVEARSSSGGSAVCSVRVYLWEGIKGEGDMRPRDLLLCREGGEGAGYGAYSYLLLNAEPAEDSRGRYLSAIQSYLRRTRDLDEFEGERQLGSLNVTYLPIRKSPEEGLAPEAQAAWLLDHYDYGCAQRLLAKLPGNHPAGPYLVSVPGRRGALPGAEPLRGLSSVEVVPGQLAERVVDQDLSAVPPELIDLWVSEFLLQMAQESFWEEPALRRVVLRMRTIIEVVGAVVPEIRQKTLEWIQLREPTAKEG